MSTRPLITETECARSKIETSERKASRKVIVSCYACGSLKTYIREQGYELIEFGPISSVTEHIAAHPDLVFCKLGRGKKTAPSSLSGILKEDEGIFEARTTKCKQPALFRGDPRKLSPKYPGDVIYNACSTGKYFIHRLDITDNELLETAKSMELRLVNIRQGYARCSIIPIDENSIITYDKGIDKACTAAGLEVLRVRPGHVLLPGLSEGLIGGTAGRLGNEILFHGDLSMHPDHEAICGFIKERRLGVRYFKDIPLTDIGSIIEI